jgi:putative hemolysin
MLMGISQLHLEKVVVRLANSPQEIRAAQHLRYKVFYDEYRAIPSAEMVASKRDFDPYDEVADHLVVVDESIADPDQRIVGTYRLLRQEVAARFGRFYTSGEYDISPLMDTDGPLLELGRSCVLAAYRTRPVLQLLWQGITDYMMDHNIALMFGCASLHGTDIDSMAVPLSYLYHHHLTPAEYRPRALGSLYVDMNILPKDQLEPKTAFLTLPPLIKGYIRVGASIGDGAVIDRQFNTVDVCIVLPMSQVAERYRRHYSRKVNRSFAGWDEPETEDMLLAARSAL